ncbi:MAG: hypothetical protein Ct9H300mP4_04780 [Gammaproteobacteria bacterium]|nr:MAG: hypothetical protein Ct9H300mP4_04780 [Gammaproteobacteria bacterium]
MKSQYVDGILVIKNGIAVAELYDGTLTPEHTHLMWSVRKTLTGLTAASVAADGFIDLKKTVADYVPELAKSGWGQDTLRKYWICETLLIGLKIMIPLRAQFADKIVRMVYSLAPCVLTLM